MGKDTRAWTGQQAGAAVNLGRALLEGVGTGDVFIGWGEVALHVRRQLSPEEIERLDPEWLACPAVDMAGATRPRRR